MEYHGVTRSRERFKAKINVAGDNYYVGFRATALEAAKAYDIAVIGFNVWQSSWSGLSKLNFPPNSFTKEEIEKVKQDLKDRYLDDLPAWYFGAYISDTGFGAFLDMELEILHLGTFPTVEAAARARDLAGLANGKWKQGDLIMNFPDAEYEQGELDVWKDWLMRRGEKRGLERLPEGLPNNRNSYWSVRALVNQCFLPKLKVETEEEELSIVPTRMPAEISDSENDGIDEGGAGRGDKNSSGSGSADLMRRRGRKRKVKVIKEGKDLFGEVVEGLSGGMVEEVQQGQKNVDGTGNNSVVRGDGGC
ncbi:hypothetical protein BSKO_04489 [Bryopsis sp. KO-2023]|nr:hypothetical protein BSKO_04489 [Bryopsis sp. KO-2023]